MPQAKTDRIDEEAYAGLRRRLELIQAPAPRSDLRRCYSQGPFGRLIQRRIVSVAMRAAAI